MDRDDVSTVPMDEQLQLPFADRFVRPMLHRGAAYLAKRTPEGQLSVLRLKLLQAGSNRRPEEFLVLKYVALAAGAFLGWLAVFALTSAGTLKSGGVLTFAAPVGGAAMGFIYPGSKLKSTVKKRCDAIRGDLPGMLDLMTISMEAGLSLDMALMRIAEGDESILGTEIKRVISEIRLGRGRMDALGGLAERNPLEELEGLVNALVQAEPLGVSLAHVLRIQSEELRRLRRQRAEEAGHKAPVKMLLPMVGCIFPTIFMILLGPAAVQIVSNMSAGK